MNPWDNDPIVSTADAPPALRQIVPPQPKQPDIPSGYEPDPDNPGHLRPIAGGPADKPGGNGTGEQGTAAGFYQRAVYANSKYGTGVPPRDAITQGIVSHLPTGIANSITGDKRQLSEAYARDFVGATLRKESGAAISPEEYNNQYIRYFPQPGDALDTIAAKARLRDTAIASLRNQAGPAATSADKSVADMLAQDEQATQDPNAKWRQPAGDIGFNYEADARGDPMNSAQQTAFDAWIKANPNATVNQLQMFAKSIGLANGLTNPQEYLDAVKKGTATGASGAVYKQPDISDVRGQNGATEKTDAAIRGAGDAASLGLADEVAAVGDTVTKGGTFADNLQRQRAIDNFDRENHFWLRTGGQLVGGAKLPLFGARSPGELAKVAATYGAIYGANSSEHLADIPKNAIAGAVTGAATAWGGAKLLGKLGAKKAGPDIPQLVDPATGELNDPLDVAGPAARYQALKDAGISNPPLGAVGGRSARVIEQGLNNLPGSAGRMEDANSAVAGDARRAADAAAEKFGSARTLDEAGQALQNGAKSWISRFEDTARKAYEAIPISPKAQSSLTNTQQALGELTTIFESNDKLATAFKSTKLNSYLEALDPEQGGGLNWKDLQAFRSRIGEEIGDQRFSDSPMKSELRRLYAALSEDMRNTAAAQGPQALRKFERANDLYRDGQQRIDGALTRILGDDSKLNPEAAAAALQTISKSGRGSGNLKQLGEIRASLMKGGDWNDAASALIRLGGQPAGAEGRQFNPKTFVDWYSGMTEPARNLIFGGPNKELRQELDKFVQVGQQLAKSKGLVNTSNTAPSFIGAGFLGGLGTTGALGFFHPATWLATATLGLGAASNNVMARLWTRPGFVRWATGYTKMLAGAERAGNAVDPTKVKTQVRLLEKVATADPAITQDALKLRSLILGANDNAKLAASPNPDSEQQNQQ
jgi:hypothetical protein